MTATGHEKPAFSRNCADEQLTLFGDDHGNPATCGSKRTRVNGYGIRLGRDLSLSEPIGTIRAYDDLVTVARARMIELDITFEILDAVSGVQSRLFREAAWPQSIEATWRHVIFLDPGRTRLAARCCRRRGSSRPDQTAPGPAPVTTRCAPLAASCIGHRLIA